MPVKNNVTRLLDSRKIVYTVYELPAEKLGALGTADLLGISADVVFKTIVVTRKPGKPILAMIPGTHAVDLKMLAKFLGEKKIVLSTQHEAEKLTQLRAGGISPLALLNKGFVIVLDASARDYAEIHISGGQRGLNIRLGVDDLIKLVNARVGEISRKIKEVL
ncbi:MAG: aminoacyl-tRNA deacylase [Anaerolineae bacterium]|jgi:Cys-tRNA(Pro)/Cys-tRNA(Cys) deacylase|nr:aminoacyl-tRNA deacylase [Anaerolineae bacterium]MBT7071198.1 aminoacyl-tRNA deacylase [Anaerolineae bacterium]MBT7324460.1 aminoacyl-tRNA deacylase [Anaerolineae bacterium]